MDVSSPARLPRRLEQLSRVRELAASGEARRLRLGARLSQGEVAAACGTSPSAVSRWESGERVPRGRAAEKYAAIIVGLASGRKAEQ
jgi:transcriptional regulator with XRE-family HTH domain